MLLWILGSLVLAVVVFIGRKMYESSSPQGFARELAKAQLHAFPTAKKKQPAASPRELYQLALQTRPGYPSEDIAELIAFVEEGNKPGERVTLRLVVYSMATREFRRRTGNRASTQDIVDISEGVFEVIPRDL